MMTKTMLLIASILAASPVAAQTTTTCRDVVFNQPQYGTTCESQTQQQAPRRSGLASAQLQLDDGSSAADQSLRARELALRERELRVREAEAGIAPPPAPSTGRRIGKALFGF